MAAAPIRQGLQFAVVLALLPAVAAADSDWSLLCSDESDETVYKTLDIRGLDASTHDETLRLRLRLADVPTPDQPEATSTMARELRYAYRLYFEIYETASPRTVHAASLASAAALTPHVSGSGPFYVSLDWEHALDLRPGPVDALKPAPSKGVKVQGHVVDKGLMWTIQRADLASAGGLDSEREWTLARAFATARLQGGVVDATTSWAARHQTSELLGVDRAPAKEYGEEFRLGGGQKSGGSAPKDSMPAASEPRPRGWSLPVPEFAPKATAPSIEQQSASVWLGTAALGALSLLLRPRFAYLLLVGLFSRIARDEALDHPRRSLLVDAVGANPGITFAALRALVPMGSGPLMHHLTVLERQRLVHSVRENGRRRYYLPGQHARSAPDSTVQQRVLSIVAGAPGAAAHEVAAAAGLTRTGALYHLHRLEAQGRIRSAARGRQRGYYPA